MLKTQELDIMSLEMEILAQDSANLTEFTAKGRFHNHIGYGKAFVFRKPSAERGTHANAMTMIGHSTRLKILG
jgi:hypothetical protein